MTIKARKTLGGIQLIEVDSNPIIAGATAPIGSMAFLVDSVNSRQFTKVGPNDIDWVQSSVSGAQVSNSVQTLDDAPTQILSIPIALNNFIKLSIDAIGVTEDGVTGAIYSLDVTAKNTDGVTQIVDIQNRFTSAQDNNLSFDLDVSGENIIASVTGLAGVTLDWSSVSQENYSSLFAPIPASSGLEFWQNELFQTEKHQYSNGGTTFTYLNDLFYSGDFSFTTDRAFSFKFTEAGTYRVVGDVGMMVAEDSTNESFNMFFNLMFINEFLAAEIKESFGSLALSFDPLKDPDNLGDYQYFNIDTQFEVTLDFPEYIFEMDLNSIASPASIVWLVLTNNFRIEKVV